MKAVYHKDQNGGRVIFGNTLRECLGVALGGPDAVHPITGQRWLTAGDAEVIADFNDLNRSSGEWLEVVPYVLTPHLADEFRDGASNLEGLIDGNGDEFADQLTDSKELLKGVWEQADQ